MSNYWKSRFDQVEQAANNKSVKYVKQLEKKYQTAAQEIDKQINAWYQRLADNNGVSMTEARKLLSASELKEFKWTVEDYIKAGEENALDQRWMKELENASAKFHINRLEALKLECRQQVEQVFAGGQEAMFDTLADVYKDTFYRSCFEIQKGVGVGFDVSKLDDGQVSKLLMKPWSVDGTNFSEKVWKNKTKLINTLDQELSRMVLTGESPKKAIQNIRKLMDTSLYNAKRLVLTEQAYFCTLGQKDAFGELDVEEYEIVATLDSKTSEVCQEQDGKHYPVKDMTPGVNAPPFHVFCRTTTCPYFDDEFTIGDKRAAKDEETGEWYEVPANLSYKDWKKTFVDGGSKDGLTPIVSEELVEDVKVPLLSHETAEIDYRAEKVTFKDLQEWKKSIGNVTDEEYAIISGMSETGYIRSQNSYKINKAMREGTIDKLSEGNQKTISTLKDVIDKNVSDRDAVLIRKVDYEYIKGVYDIDSENVEDIVEQLNKKVGATYVEKGFVSTSYKLEKNLNVNDKIELDIYAPKGTNMFLTKNREESEIILQAGTKLELEGAVLTDDGKARLLMRVVEEPLENTGKVILEQTTKITKKNYSSDYGIVNRKLVNSKKYHDKFEGLTDHKSVNEVIYQEAMTMLEHRDGTPFEDLIVIDSRSGNVVARFTESTTPGKVSLTAEQADIILKYDGNMILLHNHPNGSRASYTDIKNLKMKNIDATIAAGHDGSIYFVSELDTKFDIDGFWDEVYNSYKDIYKDDILANHHATDDLYDLGVFVVESR